MCNNILLSGSLLLLNTSAAPAPGMEGVPAAVIMSCLERGCDLDSGPVCAIDEAGVPRTFENRCMADLAYCRFGTCKQPLNFWNIVDLCGIFAVYADVKKGECWWWAREISWWKMYLILSFSLGPQIVKYFCCMSKQGPHLIYLTYIYFSLKMSEFHVICNIPFFQYF